MPWAGSTPAWRGGSGEEAGAGTLPTQGLRAADAVLPPATGQLGHQGLLGHLADHVVEDAPVMEISELHVGVKPHDSLEGLPGIQLDLDFHSWFQGFWNANSVSFTPSESQGVCILPREVLERDHPIPTKLLR